MTEVSFGEWLKRQRMGKGLTREQLAQQIGCAVITLRKIEAEERRPSAQIIERLAEILDIPQDQNTAFLRFARGDWQAAPTGGAENFPWLAAPAQEPTADGLSQPAIHLATFLFTDIEGSAKLWDQAPEKMKVALQRHHAILQDAISSNGGQVFQIVGDAFCAVFPTVHSAIAAAVQAQLVLFQEQWDTPFPIRVRMGIHTGEAERSPHSPLLGGYASNQTLNRVARILSAAHGGQVLFSLATTDLVKDSLPANTDLRDMGEHHLRNLIHPEHLFQLNIAGLPSEFPPLNTLDSAHHNLPVQVTSFIGREKEITDVIRLFEKPRMVTLTGPGGTGKTRLSIQVANELLEQYPDGIWFVELAPILDPLLVPRTTAIAIGLRDEPQRPVIDMLCDYLREKNMLIILDNCEHLVDACARLADTLLHACPHICILATSREPLGIAGETAYLVPSLQLPDMLQNLASVESLNQCEAFRLFTERASAATQKFSVTDENASAIARICHRLDGIPLAIELAAGRVRALGVQQIAQRLDDHLHLLTGGSRTALPRHQTLQAAIGWSYNLLSLGEQALFRRLSVFVNGWTLEAAELVCSGGVDATAEDVLKAEDILDLLSQLVNKSLVMTEEGYSELRYHMLETIRQYASQKLVEAGESDALRDKHLEYFLNLAETADPHLRRTEQVEWLKRLDAEYDNLRAALAWAMGRPSAELVLRLAGSLGTFWQMRAYWLEGARWLDQALGRAWDENSKSEKAARAKALYRRANLAQDADELDVMKTAAESALALCEELEDPWGIAFSRALVAIHQLRLRVYEVTIRTALEQSLNEFQRMGDAGAEARVLHELAMSFVLAGIGTREELLEIIQRALARARASGDREQNAFSLAVLAAGLMDYGEWDESERILQEAEQLYTEIDLVDVLPIHVLRAQIFFARGNLGEAKAEAKLVIENCARLGERYQQGMMTAVLALIAEAENELESAITYAQKTLELARKMGTLVEIAWALILVGIFRYRQGHIEVAMQYMRDSLEFVRRGKVADRTVLKIFDHLAGLFVEKETQVAVHILAFTESLARSSAVRKDSQLDKPYFDRFLSEARTKLSEAEFTSSWEAGSKMTMDEAIAYALEKSNDND